MKTACLVMALSTTVVATAYATESLQILKEGSWVCSTPEAYDQAIDQERHLNGQSPEELRTRLLEKKLCIYVDAEFVEKMMAPFAQVLERQGTKVKVSFTVEFRKRLEILHRRITRVTFAGWTDAGNLREKEIL